MENKLKRKIKILTHELEYYKRVYPRSDKINKLRSKIYYYNKKLAGLITS